MRPQLFIFVHLKFLVTSGIPWEIPPANSRKRYKKIELEGSFMGLLDVLHSTSVQASTTHLPGQMPKKICMTLYPLLYIVISNKKNHKLLRRLLIYAGIERSGRSSLHCRRPQVSL